MKKFQRAAEDLPDDFGMPGGGMGGGMPPGMAEIFSDPGTVIIKKFVFEVSETISKFLKLVELKIAFS